ncbi:DeoR/GlpR family DNA-binding transcription regulator [Kribbella sp. NPDC020789]
MRLRLNARQRAILREVEGREYVEVKDLAHRLDVDVSTIRRDLQGLVRDDLVERLHGGVRRRTADSPPVAFSTTPDSGIDAIAHTARRMVRNGDRIALGAGICIDRLVGTLFDVEDLTVITTDLQSAERLSRQPNIRVVIAGGELRDAPGSTVVSGAATAEFLAAQQADWVFLEVDGIHPFAGITTSHTWHVSTARALLSAGDRRVGLARSQAFGARCVGFIAEASELDLVITDDRLTDAELPAFAGRIVRASLDPTDDWRTEQPPTYHSQRRL